MVSALVIFSLDSAIRGASNQSSNDMGGHDARMEIRTRQDARPVARRDQRGTRLSVR